MNSATKCVFGMDVDVVKGLLNLEVKVTGAPRIRGGSRRYPAHRAWNGRLSSSDGKIVVETMRHDKHGISKSEISAIRRGAIEWSPT
jgi:hypothetical protein